MPSDIFFVTATNLNEKRLIYQLKCLNEKYHKQPNSDTILFDYTLSPTKATTTTATDIENLKHISDETETETVKPEQHKITFDAIK